MTQTLRLYLVRHGQTEWSLSGQHTGRSDIPLTAEGEDEARALAPWLGGLAFEHVFASPRQRAQRTCALAGLGAKAEIEPDLVEWDYGEYEGKRTVDIYRQRPHWSIATRADRLIARLIRMEGKIALFSHGQFGVVLAARWIGLPVIEAQHFSLTTASISVLGYAASHPDVPVIMLWNATPELPGSLQT
jgi:probable phosphoglycerate mutase